MSTIGRRSKISCSRSRSYSTSCYPAVTQNGPPRRTHAENKGVGERGRNRTFNLLIKSQLLCQLSYAPFSGLHFSPWDPAILSRVAGDLPHGRLGSCLLELSIS